MGGSSRPAGKKMTKEERRLRNLASANSSRQRSKEVKSDLTEQKAYLTEANAMLSTRLGIQPSGSVPPLRPAGSSSQHGQGNLGPGMSSIVGKDSMEEDALMDIFDRAISGGRGKGPSLDAEAAKRYAAAAKKAPKDVKRPMKYVEPGSSGKKTKASSSKSGGKPQASSSTKK